MPEIIANKRNRMLGSTYLAKDEVVRIPHREDLVEEYFTSPAAGRKKYCLVTPFAGKQFCMKEYLRGIRRLPLEQFHAVWYDNSCDSEFSQNLCAIASRLFSSFTIIRDMNRPHTVENTAEEYSLIDKRVFAIYNEIAKNHIPDCDYVMIVEDDVEIPESCLERLEYHMKWDEKLATVVGSMNARRLKDLNEDGTPHPVAWQIRVTNQVGGTNEVWAETQEIPSEQENGFEIIGSAHTGCWLTRADAVRNIGFAWEDDGISFVDQTWGYRVHKAGLRMGIDWGVKTKHYYQLDGKTLFA